MTISSFMMFKEENFIESERLFVKSYKSIYSEEEKNEAGKDTYGLENVQQHQSIHQAEARLITYGQVFRFWSDGMAS